MSGPLNEVEVEVDIVGRSGLAYLVSDGDREVWLPRSLCRFDMDTANNTATVTLPEWLAKDKELI